MEASKVHRANPQSESLTVGAKDKPEKGDFRKLFRNCSFASLLTIYQSQLLPRRHFSDCQELRIKARKEERGKTHTMERSVQTVRRWLIK